jgi:hypothetical protein
VQEDFVRIAFLFILNITLSTASLAHRLFFPLHHSTNKSDHLFFTWSRFPWADALDLGFLRNLHWCGELFYCKTLSKEILTGFNSFELLIPGVHPLL